MQLATGHENPDCSFVDEASKVEGLKVAEQALTALSSGDLVAPHHTVFLPNDKAFTSLIAALSEPQLTPCFQNEYNTRII